MPDFDTSVPHIARVYDYWLGGKDNFAVDRELGERTLAAYPNLVFSVRANRAFLARAMRFLAAEAGIRQFLDVGTGIPPPTTPTRWPSARRKRAGSSTSTMTRSSCRTPRRC